MIYVSLVILSDKSVVNIYVGNSYIVAKEKCTNYESSDFYVTKYIEYWDNGGVVGSENIK